jgi:hypothetical protein
VSFVAFFVKVAVTDVSPLTVTVQVPVPRQASQPAKFEPDAGVAVSVTEVPAAYAAEQAVPQLIPDGELVTVPDPEPAVDTVSVWVRAKFAVTVVLAFSVTWHVPVPEQPPPDQPAKAEPVAGAAVSVTTVPLVNEWVQVDPQLIPAGELVTVPVPAPPFVTVSVWWSRSTIWALLPTVFWKWTIIAPIPWSAA